MGRRRVSLRWLAIAIAIFAATGLFGGVHAHAADRIAVTVTGKGPTSC